MHMSFIRNIQLSENRKTLFLSFLSIIRGRLRLIYMLNRHPYIYLNLLISFLFLPQETAASSNEKPHDNIGRVGIRTSSRLVASYCNADFGDERLHAYTEESRCDSEGCEYIKLSNPFGNKQHPREVRKAHYFIGESYGSGSGFYIDPIHAENTYWDFSKNEERTLDYSVYLWVYNKHPKLLFNQKQMRIDLLYFIPYIEIDDAIYVLSWNKESEVSGSLEINNYAVEFPNKGENNSNVGVIIAPMMKIKKNKDVLEMESDILGDRTHLQLRFRVFDKKGKPWVLSWRKINIKRYINKEDEEIINIEF